MVSFGLPFVNIVAKMTPPVSKTELLFQRLVDERAEESLGDLEHSWMPQKLPSVTTAPMTDLCSLQVIIMVPKKDFAAEIQLPADSESLTDAK